ncbi:NAD-dependent epimerase/dehydratase family protein [Zavarzinella formosa]|uniref:NAD-dependent epimerase/dehydratase family protein n=1 Tax=Zavarzinella formosa TaxID=360055 RepID=UPI0002DAD34C|nr:NAD-dependent epimerase/dehydratase family protein [Zavarzinella formosa]
MSDLSLVTGGAGFIGSHLVDALVKRGDRVRVLDDLSTGQAANIERHGDRVELITGSILDQPVVAKAVAGAKTVYHLGALASVARSVETPLISHAACATGTLQVLDEARKAGVKRVVFAASSSMYGGATTDDGQKEDQTPCALSPYAAAKLAGEYYMQAFAATYGIETVRVRFFNIFGPRQRPDSPYSGVIAIFTSLLSQGKTPVVHGDGLQSRDFTYVGNAVQALMKAASSPGVSGQVFNVGTGNSVTVLRLVEELNKTLGTNIKPELGPARAGDVRYSKADISRTRALLGYEPAVTFEEGLAKTTKWYRGENWE